MRIPFFRICVAVAGVVLLLGAGAIGLSLERAHNVERAIDVLRDRSQSTERHKVAIDLLSQSKKPRATEALVEIALDSQIWPDTRLMALTALSGRSDANLQGISVLLQPHNALVLREKTAFILQDACRPACIRDVLRYLERMWWGEKPGTLTTNQPTAALQEFAERERKFDALLESILANRKAETIDELQSLYGLGSVHPSPFAVHLVAELGFADACQQLSRQFIHELADERTSSELDIATQKLNCPKR